MVRNPALKSYSSGFGWKDKDANQISSNELSSIKIELGWLGWFFVLVQSLLSTPVPKRCPGTLPTNGVAIWLGECNQCWWNMWPGTCSKAATGDKSAAVGLMSAMKTMPLPVQFSQGPGWKWFSHVVEVIWFGHPNKVAENYWLAVADIFASMPGRVIPNDPYFSILLGRCATIQKKTRSSCLSVLVNGERFLANLATAKVDWIVWILLGIDSLDSDTFVGFSMPFWDDPSWRVYQGWLKPPFKNCDFSWIVF